MSPVAQNVQASGQPDWDDTQTVRRLRWRMATASTGNPSRAENRTLIVPSCGALHLLHREVEQRDRLRQLRTQPERQRRDLVIRLRKPLRHGLFDLPAAEPRLALLRQERCD